MRVEIGDRVQVEVTAIAHGGHCVARHEGQVIFVRYAIPGETVIVEITGKSKNFSRANCVEVLKSSPFRVKPPCVYATASGCGGCDFQHIDPAEQRRLKSQIIKEQFKRVAKLEVDVEVEEVAPGLHWRSRMEFTVTPTKKLGLFSARSNQLVEIDNCLIAHEATDISGINALKLPAGKKVDVVISSGGDRQVVIQDRENNSLVSENSTGKNFSLNPSTFWQSHINAPQTLTKVVKEFAQVKNGDHVFDLYGGAGLFTAALQEQIGAGGRITLIESDQNAITDARRVFALDANIEIVQSKVESALKRYVSADVVVLDPPRAGAGAQVVSAIAKLGARNLVYVACDPASLARDTGYLRDVGYELQEIRAFDLFPMTAHMECVARFMPTRP